MEEKNDRENGEAKAIQPQTMPKRFVLDRNFAPAPSDVTGNLTSNTTSALTNSLRRARIHSPAEQEHNNKKAIAPNRAKSRNYAIWRRSGWQLRDSCHKNAYRAHWFRQKKNEEHQELKNKS